MLEDFDRWNVSHWHTQEVRPCVGWGHYGSKAVIAKLWPDVTVS